MIFPGMDPYLEHPQNWPDFHDRMIVYIAEALGPGLRPRYVARVNERVYVQSTPQQDYRPDVLLRATHPEFSHRAAVLEADAPLRLKIVPLETRETYLEIIDRQANQRVIAAIELLSPTNKSPGEGQKEYRAKQSDFLASQTHLVEIDLLRSGQHVLAVSRDDLLLRTHYEYVTCVSRAVKPRERAEVYPSKLRERLPHVIIPLQGSDEAVLDLQAVVAKTYEIGAYRLLMRYDQPCQPPLSPEDQAWADERIQTASTA